MTDLVEKEKEFLFIILMSLLTSMMALSIDSMMPALSVMGVDLRAKNPNDVQYIISVIFLGFSVGQLLFGPLSDSWGRKRPIYVGGAIFISGCLLSATSTSMPVMLIGRFFQGFGVSAFRIISVAIVRDKHSGAKMAEILSLVMTIFILAPLVAPFLGQFIMLSFSWRAIFLLLTLLSIASILWLEFGMPETHPEDKRTPVKLSTLVYGTKETFSQTTTVYTTIIATLVSAGFISYLSSAQQVFREYYQLGEKFPFYFSSLALMVGIASFTNSKLVRRFGLITIIRFALITFTASSIGFALYLWQQQNFLPPLPLFMLYLAVTFLSIGLLFGNLNSLSLSPLGHIAGLASSITGSIQNFFSVIVGALIAHQLQGNIYPIVLGMMMVSTLSLAIFSWGRKRDWIVES